MAGLAEIDGAEIVAILLFRRSQMVILNEFQDHGLLRDVIDCPKRNVVHRSRALARGQKFSRFPQVDDTADVKALRPITFDRAFAAIRNEPENIGQNRRCWRGISQKQTDAMKAADCVLDRNIATAPPRLGFDPLRARERKPGPVAVPEGQRSFAEALDRGIMPDALLYEAMGPVAD